MASKASLLQSNVKKTSGGLFAGMTPLNKESEEKKQSSVKPVAGENTKAKSEPEKIKKPEVEKAVEIQKEPVNNEVKNTSAEEVVAPVTKTVAEPVNVTPLETKVETPVANGPVLQNYQQNIPQSQPQQIMPEPAPVNYTQQVPVQQYTQIPQSQYQPVQQAGYQNPVLTQQNTAPKQAKQEKSRYEKDKFLLLDIRNLRDYVEHMAKASNMSATKYIRSLIEQDMNKNWDIYQAHKQLEEALKERR